MGAPKRAQLGLAYSPRAGLRPAWAVKMDAPSPAEQANKRDETSPFLLSCDGVKAGGNFQHKHKEPEAYIISVLGNYLML